MPDNGFSYSSVNGVPVVSTPEEIDVTNADQLRAALLDATSGKEPVVVLDMSGTQFCDSAGLHTVFRAHRRVAAESRELRLVITPDGAVPRILALTAMDRHLSCFTRLEQAIAEPYSAPASAGEATEPRPDQAQDEDQAAS